MSTYVQVTIDVASPEAGVIKEVIHIFFMIVLCSCGRRFDD
jgi:hypothetical protein